MDMDTWYEAYEWAYQRAREEGDVDIDRDYTIIDRWAAEYYEDLIRERNEYNA